MQNWKLLGYSKSKLNIFLVNCLFTININIINFQKPMRCSPVRITPLSRTPCQTSSSKEGSQRVYLAIKPQVTEYQASIGNIGKVIMSHCLNYHPYRCRMKCQHKLFRHKLNPYPLEEPCTRYIKL